MTGNDAVLLTQHNDIAVLTLNRPDSRNAIDDAMREALLERLDAVEQDPGLRALVITGAGKCFSAGGDIAAMRARLDAPAGEIAFNGFQRQIRTHQAISRLHGFQKPVIAAVNGPAVGLGADLALACDFVLSSESAFFAISYMLRGLIPDGGSLYLLPRRVGLAKAKDLIYSGRRVGTEEALRIGLADRAAAPEALMQTALDWAHDLSRGSLTAMALGKTLLDRSFETGLEDIFELGGRSQAICYSSAEHRAAVEEFLTKA